jgi:hypothetical protein
MTVPSPLVPRDPPGGWADENEFDSVNCDRNAFIILYGSIAKPGICNIPFSNAKFLRKLKMTASMAIG